MPVFNGGVGRDTLNGTAQADTISGGEGGDVLNGRGGNDVIYGFGAEDTAGDVGAISATLVASGLSRPVFAGSPPGDPDRLFILEQHTGQIKILDLGTGQIAATPFLDIAQSDLSTDGEQGLLGLAFHPDYATNGIYFVNLTNASGATEVWRYTRGPDPDVSQTTRELVISFSGSPATNHNAGWMSFGPDGYLYIATGDGGGGNDPDNLAQNINSLFGKILRLDIDGDDFPGDPNRNYAIPSDNPFVGVNGADEVYAIGLRNPWRNSFDAATGDVWIADVGQGQREEINYIPAGTLGGRNFGWVVMEGELVNDPNRPGNPPPNDPSLTDPLYAYGHGVGPTEGFAVIGGYVYRGPSVGMQGAYVFSDTATGNLWTLRAGPDGVEDFMVRNDQIVVNGGDLDRPTSFAVDGQGRLYWIGIDGDIHRLDFAAGAGDANDTLIGGAGADDMFGGLGDDMLRGDSGADDLNGGAGTDTATYATSTAAVRINLDAGIGRAGDAQGDRLALIENVTGSAFDDGLTGSSDANVLRGQDGDDVLSGLGGADVLIGGAGADAFVFRGALGAGNVDRIVDFDPTQDGIRLENADFVGLASGLLAAGAFRIGPTAADADDRIIYNPVNGALLFDPDGAGGASQVRFATLNPGLSLTAGDFLVV